MRLHRLTITAFGPFGTTQTIDFDALSSAGLFLLHGPTGAGKTSVLDAVCYALYGAVPGARQSPGTSLRSDHAPAELATEVELELTVGGRRLEITRSPAQPRPKKKGTGFTTEKAQSRLREYDPDDGWRPLSRSHQEIGEEITQLIGMSREQFCQVVLLPQGDFARFLRADAEARGKLLGRLFDTRRFAAVEERLAELRRGAETKVRDGDERVLAVAQRIAQAAGPAGREAPLPGIQPGEPGLAEGVLEWAATARSVARERLDIAACVLAMAEGRQSAARQALDSERELAALQQRYEETRRRAAVLEDRRPDRDRCHERLARARKADLVAPALDLRDEAERAYRMSCQARDRARAVLPGTLADAGAEQLAELERRLRQELGGLEAAKRAELRSAAIDAERAGLERQARADDELIREAEVWLADWESTRDGLRARIEAAQEAATHAEQLAGRLEPARARLDAARRRDALADRVAAAAERLATARENAAAAHESWLELRERRLRDIAAELAAELVDGENCKVCGSADHPDPARAADGHVDRATEERALDAHRRADQARTHADRELGVVREQHAAARAAAQSAVPQPRDGAGATDPAAAAHVSATAGSAGAPASGTGAVAAGPAGTGSDADPTVAELAALVDRLTGSHAEAYHTAAGMHAAREALAATEREQAERLEGRQLAERRAAARTSLREGLDREQAALEAELTVARGETGSVAEHAALLERRVGLLAAAAEAVREEETAAQHRKEADDRLADAAFRAGFDTPQAAAETLLPDAEQRELQRLVDAWQSEAAAVADRLAETETRAAAERPPAAVDAARTAYDAAERLLRDASAALAAARERCAELGRLSRRAADEVRGLGPLREEYDRVARLAGLTAGTSADNERKMRLESYVLAARLEQVAAAATARLQRMSSGRYTLVHSDARTGGRRSGLGLHVVDAWTGRERDTATLSGGETFFASLALALGLADVVTDEAGGVRLDTLFIDEGFGSLDDQTLDEVLDVLDSLRERDRSVGIVSHVADLRRRIPAQLEVVKERHGSAVRHRTTGEVSG
ncbi:SMC family ATPase [Streptomyces sp. NBC_00257]|uniref:AAA family ATPase n=1 Tax=unclassified Streptomyces TaxID=2593676 RepID=UPI002253985F|nr:MULTISPECIES: SMC family ATPase [unclassified Streptomyces]MCX5433220.1 SMC family ATPase [Streptomyces sp. NBC_00062]WTB52769.1 SMC family ATPase [Streptomyces sp. NBC_00826]WTH94339.1 SMC family ATPase [Streptomyces sp. NBC_00825]WTI03074.1 SMC family ATPase [Streptomyces sp. NBC_00822]